MISAIHAPASDHSPEVPSLPTSSPPRSAALPRPTTPILNHAHVSPSSSPPLPQTALAWLSLQEAEATTDNGSVQNVRLPTTTGLASPNGRAEAEDSFGSRVDKGKGRAVDQGGEAGESAAGELYYRPYRSEEEDLGELMRLVEEELSEPYNIYTFRYFLIEWPHLSFLVFPSSTSTIPIGTIVCKQDQHRNRTNRGYIAMLSVDRKWRRRGIASKLIGMAIEEMTRRGAHEIVLETECDNTTSLALYESLGFMREKALQRFYSNGKDAYRLLLPLPNHPYLQTESAEETENARWDVSQGPDWLDGLGDEEAFARGMGGPAVGNWGTPPRAGTPRPGHSGDGKGWKPDLPPRPSEWDGMYT